MQINYIFLGNGEEWCQKSASGLSGDSSVHFFNGFPATKVKYYRMIKKCYSNRIPRIIKNILMFFIHKNILKKLTKLINANTRLIIYDWNVLGGDENFIRKIKEKYKNISLIYIFTNITRISGAATGNYLEKLNDWYDVVFAFDPMDADIYKFSYSPLIYDADINYKKREKESKENYVFYIGQAKDRFLTLLSCFEKIKSLNIKTKFYITNVEEKDIKNEDEITYNKFISYDKCVDYIQQSTCLLDIIQGNSTGLTIKTCEAICYDKKLITTNKHVMEYPFYDPKYIKVIESSDDIDEAFFNENKNVRYSEDGKKYFSAKTFLERLEIELRKKESS